jgi:glycosyltransferase involved in cell wall biosynthesis
MLASRKGTQSEHKSEKFNSERKIMLFELDVRGHHPGYIQHLVTYWCQQELTGHLDVLVSPKFLEQHSNIVDIATQCNQKNIKFVAITKEEEAVLIDGALLADSFKGRIQRAFQEWELLRKYAVSLGTTHCLIMYLDTVLLRLALAAKFPCHFSSIYFRPIFHYSNFPNYVMAGRENFWHWRDKVCLSSLLKNPQLQTILCLDTFAVEQLNKFKSKAKVVYLPDPVQIYNESETKLEKLRQTLGIQPDRKVFLLFGVLSERKGIYQLLDAISLLQPNLCEKISLLLIGPLEFSEKEKIQSRIAEISQSLPIQIICSHDFISDREIQPYFQIADVILAPYQRHIGMSAILVRAAAAQTPVLSSDFGLMGEITRRYKLGLAVDSTVPSEIAQGFHKFLLESPASLCDQETMKQFAEQNKAEKFASTIFQCLETRTE